MADLRVEEKAKLQRYLEMGQGYVCDFTNATFQAFFAEHIEVDIYSTKYSQKYSGSKAGRLREFWEQESNEMVARLLNDLIDYWQEQMFARHFGEPIDRTLFEQCKNIAKRLASVAGTPDISALRPNIRDESFDLVARSVAECVEKGEYERGLDHLHTFVVKYFRTLSGRYGISYTKDTALNSLVSGYVRILRERNLIESRMALEILSGSIKILGEFDHVRNNHSLAHDNKVLNRPESLLIFSNVSSTIRFIEALEKAVREKMSKDANSDETRAMELDKFLADEALEAQAFDQWVEEEIDRRQEF